MQIDLNLLFAAILCLSPLALVLTVLFRKRKEQREFRRAPFKELQRRPAGETLRIKLEELDENISDQIAKLMMLPFILVIVLFALHPKELITPSVFFVFSVGWAGFYGVKLLKTLKTRSNYKLGFEGERYVAEELSRLIGVGFEIYHDIPFDGFNIDHVLVSSAGVFAVETKTRRKPVDESGNKEYRVLFDGKFLQWPWGPDNYGIEQAANNARTLSKWLSGAVGESVGATAILTLPGWMVDRKAPYDGVYVLNPKEIYQVCSSGRANLSDQLVHRICYQLDQKCRVTVK